MMSMVDGDIVVYHDLFVFVYIMYCKNIYCCLSSKVSKRQVVHQQGCNSWSLFGRLDILMLLLLM